MRAATSSFERERRRQFLADRIVVCESFAARLVLLAQGVQLLGSIKSVVGPSGLHELFRVFQVDVAPLALAVRRMRAADADTLVDLDAAPLERLEDILLGTRHETLRVGIFDTKNHRTAVPTREQVVIKRRTYAADMQRPRRAGCEAHPDRSFHISLLFVDFLFIVMFGFGRLATGRILRRCTPRAGLHKVGATAHSAHITHTTKAPDTTRQTASFLKATTARSRTKNIRSVHREVSARAIFARFPIPFT